MVRRGKATGPACFAFNAVSYLAIVVATRIAPAKPRVADSAEPQRDPGIVEDGQHRAEERVPLILQATPR